MMMRRKSNCSQGGGSMQRIVSGIQETHTEGVLLSQEGNGEGLARGSTTQRFFESNNCNNNNNNNNNNNCAVEQQPHTSTQSLYSAEIAMMALTADENEALFSHDFPSTSIQVPTTFNNITDSSTIEAKSNAFLIKSSYAFLRKSLDTAAVSSCVSNDAGFGYTTEQQQYQQQYLAPTPITTNVGAKNVNALSTTVPPKDGSGSFADFAIQQDLLEIGEYSDSKDAINGVWNSSPLKIRKSNHSQDQTRKQRLTSSRRSTTRGGGSTGSASAKGSTSSSTVAATTTTRQSLRTNCIPLQFICATEAATGSSNNSIGSNSAGAGKNGGSGIANHKLYSRDKENHNNTPKQLTALTPSQGCRVQKSTDELYKFWPVRNLQQSQQQALQLLQAQHGRVPLLSLSTEYCSNVVAAQTNNNNNQQNQKNNISSNFTSVNNRGDESVQNQPSQQYAPAGKQQQQQRPSFKDIQNLHSNSMQMNTQNTNQERESTLGNATLTAHDESSSQQQQNINATNDRMVYSVFPKYPIKRSLSGMGRAAGYMIAPNTAAAAAAGTNNSCQSVTSSVIMNTNAARISRAKTEMRQTDDLQDSHQEENPLQHHHLTVRLSTSAAADPNTNLNESSNVHMQQTHQYNMPSRVHHIKLSLLAKCKQHSAQQYQMQQQSHQQQGISGTKIHTQPYPAAAAVSASGGNSSFQQSTQILEMPKNMSNCLRIPFKQMHRVPKVMKEFQENGSSLNQLRQQKVVNSNQQGSMSIAPNRSMESASVTAEKPSSSANAPVNLTAYSASVGIEQHVAATTTAGGAAATTAIGVPKIVVQTKYRSASSHKCHSQISTSAREITSHYTSQQSSSQQQQQQHHHHMLSFQENSILDDDAYIDSETYSSVTTASAVTKKVRNLSAYVHRNNENPSSCLAASTDFLNELSVNSKKEMRAHSSTTRYHTNRENEKNMDIYQMKTNKSYSSEKSGITGAGATAPAAVSMSHAAVPHDLDSEQEEEEEDDEEQNFYKRPQTVNEVYSGMTNQKPKAFEHVPIMLLKERCVNSSNNQSLVTLEKGSGKSAHAAHRRSSLREVQHQQQQQHQKQQQQLQQQSYSLKVCEDPNMFMQSVDSQLSRPDGQIYLKPPIGSKSYIRKKPAKVLITQLPHTSLPAAGFHFNSNTSSTVTITTAATTMSTATAVGATNVPATSQNVSTAVAAAATSDKIEPGKNVTQRIKDNNNTKAWAPIIKAKKIL